MTLIVTIPMGVLLVRESGLDRLYPYYIGGNAWGDRQMARFRAMFGLWEARQVPVGRVRPERSWPVFLARSGQ